VRLLEMFEREGKDFVVGLFRRMLTEAEQGARKRLASWLDGTYRCVTFGDGAGMERGLLRNCHMAMAKTGDSVHIDFTGTSPETRSTYNAHPQAVIGHLANYIYEYVFHDLPISSATFQPFTFTFPPNTMLYPDARAATSNSVMACSGAMSSIASCVSRARFGTSEWRQVAASLGNGGNASVLAGMSQWGMEFADMLAYTINTEGSGARSHSDGINAYGFPWCAFGRAPDVESMENELPMLVLFSQHWEDSAGAGKYRGGVGTAQLWVTHNAPFVVFMAIADNSVVQTPQPLFGGYAMATVPGIRVEDVDIPELLRAGDQGRLDLASLLEGKYGGRLVSETYGRTAHPVGADQVITVGFSSGGAGFGDPLDREPSAVERDVTAQMISQWSARNVYGVVLDPTSGRVDEASTDSLRADIHRQRLSRGKPYDEFVAEWSQRKPPAEALGLYGSWPEAEATAPVMRP
jgi:acetophenone carboxylase